MTDEPPAHEPPADDFIAARTEKHRRALADGAYPYRFDRSHLAAELHERFGQLQPGDEDGFRRPRSE